MTTGMIIAMVVVFVAVDALVIGAIFAWVASTLREFTSAFPARDIAPDAIRRRFQGIGIDLMNLGGCVHIAVDDGHLHLEPVWLLRKMGMQPVSIPWEQVHLIKRGKSWWPARAKVGKWELRAPDWCLALADDSEPA